MKAILCLLLIAYATAGTIKFVQDKPDIETPDMYENPYHKNKDGHLVASCKWDEQLIEQDGHGICLGHLNTHNGACYPSVNFKQGITAHLVTWVDPSPHRVASGDFCVESCDGHKDSCPKGAECRPIFDIIKPHHLNRDDVKHVCAYPHGKPSCPLPVGRRCGKQSSNHACCTKGMYCSQWGWCGPDKHWYDTRQKEYSDDYCRK